MDGRGLRPAGGGKDRRAVQVSVRLAEPDRLASELHVRRPAVGVGVDGHGRKAHLAKGAEDAAGDLAPVGDQDLHDQPGLRFSRNAPSPS